MRKDFRPKWSPVTEVPIIPVHEDMDGRDEPDQHPVSAITGLADALDSKVDKAAGKGLSTEDYTTAEKAKLSLIEDGAERNVIKGVKVDGEDVTPDGDGAVWLTVPARGQYADSIAYNQSTGEIRLLAADGSELSRVQTPLRSIITAAEWDERNTRLILTKADGSRFLVPMQITLVPVTGDGVDTETSLTEGGVVVSLTQGVKDEIADRVDLHSNQEISGAKSFRANIRVRKANGPWLYLTSLQDDLSSSHAVAGISFDGTPDESENYFLWAQTDLYSFQNSIMLRNRVWNHDRSASASSGVRIDDETGTARLFAPVAVRTSGSDVLPTPSDWVVTGGMLAVDPQVVHSYGNEQIAGDKAFTGHISAVSANFDGTVTENGAINSKSVVTPAIQTVDGESRPWYKVYARTITVTTTYSMLLWSSPTSPVVASARQAGLLLVSIRGASCVLRWLTGDPDYNECQRTALVRTELESGGTEWALWVRADGSSVGRYLHRIAEFTNQGPSNAWTSITPTAEDAKADLPAGDNVQVFYSEGWLN